MQNLANRNQFAASICMSLFSIAVCSAHEYWIEPSAYVAQAGETIDVRLRVGEHFTGEPVARKNQRIERFAAVVVSHQSNKTNERLIDGVEGGDPAGSIAAEAPGLMILVYDSDNSLIELEGSKFTAYLEEKGLTRILKDRAARSKQHDKATEAYSRCAKSLVRVTGLDMDASRPLLDRPTGMPLEIVALFDPYAKSAERSMRLRVLFEGKPLPDVQVTARSKLNKRDAQVARSDVDGTVTFDRRDAGPWLIECTHMRKALDGIEAEYESFWASLTFQCVAR